MYTHGGAIVYDRMGGNNLYILMEYRKLQYFYFQKYGVTISKQLGLRGKPQGRLGDELDAQTVEMLKDDQVVQLYELMIAAKGLEGDVITADDLKNK